MGEEYQIDDSQVYMPSVFWEESSDLDYLQNDDVKNALFEVEEIGLSVMEYHYVMAQHPTFLRHFAQLEQIVIFGSGNIPIPLRFEICMLCASEFDCNYLLESLAAVSNVTIEEDGDPLSPRISVLRPLIHKLCHSPWSIDKDDYRELYLNHRWGYSELAQISLIGSLMVALVSFCYGAGVKSFYTKSTERCCVDTEDDTQVRKSQIEDEKRVVESLLPTESTSSEQATSAGSLSQSNSPTQQSDGIMHVPRNPSGRGIIDIERKSSSDLEKEGKRVSMFNELPLRDFKLSRGCPIARLRQISTSTSLYLQTPVRILPANPKFEHTPFKYREFSFEHQGLALINRLVPDLAEPLSSFINYSRTFTYNTFLGNRNVDTELIRTSVWMYTQRLFGIFHSDYDYSLIRSKLCNLPQNYLRLLAYNPQYICMKGYRDISCSNDHAEKCHFTIIGCVAHFQALVLYFLKALSACMQETCE